MHMTNSYASTLVVKYGGNAMGVDGLDPVLAEIAELHHAGTPIVLVHGGGPEIDRWLALRGVQTERIDGLRVTDAVTLEVTEAVLCATVNKRIVRELIGNDVRAIGVSGEDAALLRARIVRGSHGEDLGFVGGETQCDPALLHDLLAAKYLPVVAPLALALDAPHALNVNADAAAAAIASALKARAFVQITNVARVLADPVNPASAIDTMTLDEARAFAQSPACSGGMYPKVQAAITAVAAGAQASFICAAGPGVIARAMHGDATVVSP
jgi:acetylglutamate kinase